MLVIVSRKGYERKGKGYIFLFRGRKPVLS